MEKNVKVDAASLLGTFCILIKMQKVFLRGACAIPPAYKEPGSLVLHKRKMLSSSTDGSTHLETPCSCPWLLPYNQMWDLCVSHAPEQRQYLIQLGITWQESDWFHLTHHISVHRGSESGTKPGSPAWWFSLLASQRSPSRENTQYFQLKNMLIDYIFSFFKLFILIHPMYYCQTHQAHCLGHSDNDAHFLTRQALKQAAVLYCPSLELICRLKFLGT